MNFFLTLLTVAFAMPSPDNGEACQAALERVVDASTQQALCDSKELATAAISACEASEPVNAAAISVIKEMIAQC